MHSRSGSATTKEGPYSRLSAVEDWPDSESGLEPDTEELVEDLAQAAIELGTCKSFEALLQADPTWTPQGRHLVLAAQAGTLLQFLARFRMPLHQYPSLAKMYEKMAMDWVRDHCQLLEESAAKQEERRELSRQACMLSNFLLVPGVDMVGLMNLVVQDMIVCKVAGNKEIKPARRASQGFPGVMGALFMQRRIELNQVSMEWRPKAPGSGELVLGRPPNTAVLRTMLPFAVDVKKHGALKQLPRRTQFCTWALPSEDKEAKATSKVESGAFCYLDGDHRPLALVEVTGDQRQPLAMFFQDAVSLPAEVVQELSVTRRWCPITLSFMMEKHAEQYAFINPEEKVAGLDGGALGGFAYRFKDPSQNCFFRVQDYCDVVDRGIIRHDVNIHHLEFLPCCEKVGPALGLDSRPFGDEYEEDRPGSALCHPSAVAADKTEEMIIARLGVPGVLHPAILHGLAFTPTTAALDTLAAKAITSAAYHLARSWIVLRLAMRLGCVAAVTWFTRFMRERTIGGGAVPRPEWDRSHSVGLAVICVSWGDELARELCLLKVFADLGYLQDRFSLLAFPLRIAHLLATLLMIHNLLEVHAGTAELSRGLLALTGSWAWLHVLWSLRVFRVFRLGVRIIPIIEALGDVASFLLVTFFTFGASYQASYALTQRPMSEIMFNTYRMGFVSEMESSLFLSTEKAVQLTPRVVTEKLTYCVFTFLIMASLTNIFIQIIGQAYEEHQKNAVSSFVRARAVVTLEYAAVAIATASVWQPPDMFLWLGYRRSEKKPERDKPDAWGSTDAQAQA